MKYRQNIKPQLKQTKHKQTKLITATNQKQHTTQTNKTTTKLTTKPETAIITHKHKTE